MPSLCARILLISLIAVSPLTSICADDASAVPRPVQAFLGSNCMDCHRGPDSQAGLDLEDLSKAGAEPERFDRWVRVFDRVEAGEMPPRDAAPVPPEDSAVFLDATREWLTSIQQHEHEVFGRVHARRLTNLQLERTLHDLLGIDIPLASRLPTEPRSDGFTTVARGQSISHFQLANQLAVIDAALDEAFRRALSEPDESTREFAPRQVARSNTARRCREPEMLNGAAVVWSGTVTFYGRLPATTAREDGWYRVRLNASALKSPTSHGVWCTVKTGRCVSSAPLLPMVGAFEATDEPQDFTFEAWLPEGHMFEVRPADVTLKRARFTGGQIGTGEGEPQNVPGLAIHSVTLERIHRGPDNNQIRRWLIGDLPVRTARQLSPGEVISNHPREDAERLMLGFAERAFRRPVSAETVAPYLQVVNESLDSGEPLSAALRSGYRALLCSPRFLYFHEAPGPLDGYAVASRLSYFLWNSMPDDELLRAAADGSLVRPDILRAQVDRMLVSEKGHRFVKDFADEWLDLSEIDFTQPDRKLYRSFDEIVQHSMLAETQAFLQRLVDGDLSVSHLIDSDFSYLNSRLARFYGIDGVDGDELREVKLDSSSHRGGLMTQGAIMKVTANGTTTSPVIRGVWISERLLGKQIPPPPESVPAIEPDIRGATSIRDMLAKHRSGDSCAACHVKIDPPGFALENYDPAGQWRESYGGSRSDSDGIPVDASYDLPDGRHFDDIEGFQALILDDPAPIARNVVEKLLTYGTGASVTFADREAVERIVRETADRDHGFRSIVHAVVGSDVFLSK